MCRSSILGLLAACIGLIGAAQAAGQPTCKPDLAIRDVHLSQMQPPTFERKWTAVVSVDASRCSATSGYFDIGLSRLKDTGPELEFRERFTWSSPSVRVSVDFGADEAVEAYWIDKVQACPCAR
jgi:hypothetical protein